MGCCRLTIWILLLHFFLVCTVTLDINARDEADNDGKDNDNDDGNDNNEDDGDNDNEDEGDGEGLVEEYLLAREEAMAEIEEFYKTAEPGETLDPNSEALEELKICRDNLLKAGLPAKELAGLLKGDPGLQVENPTSSSVRKRAIESNEKRRWTKGIVPYIYTNETNEPGQVEIQRSMKTFERFTCIRFVPWENDNGQTTNQKFGLDHESYLTFVKRSGCFSFQGNIRKTEGGQLISCCGGSVCIHEIGHAMGEAHEQGSPDPARARMIRTNWENIKSKYHTSYSIKNPKYILSIGFDLSSFMQYRQGAFSIPKTKTYIKLFPELPSSNGYYYLFREVSLVHKCQDQCGDSTLTCENDGYLTLVDNKCSCMCIPGLDPATGCTTILKADPPGLDFPGGQYALPAPSAGCPDNTFSTGSRVQVNDGANSKSELYNLGGQISGKKVEQRFCVKDTAPNEFFWPGANICLYRRGGACPEGFDEGFVQYDDRPTDELPNNKSGELPDGTFDQDTRFEYCCKNRGFSRDPLAL